MRAIYFKKFILLVILALSFISNQSRAMDILATSEERKSDEDGRERLRVYQHHMNYFISGEPDTKVQLSAKARAIHGFDLFVGYTQTMFWELFTTSSSPFSDINFNPEAFYRWYMDHGMFKGLDIGAEHKSNGRSGTESRSWNRIYAEARTEFHVSNIRMGWNTKVFYLFDLDEGNRDIRHQLGFLETTLSVAGIWPKVFRDGEAYITINPGGNWNAKHIQGSREIGFRFRTPFQSFDPFIFLQLYSGMNESQLYYKEDRTTWRVGLAI